MKKRITSLLLAILLLATTCLSTACGNKETTGNATEIDLTNQIMTREQWIIGLGSSFGMSDYTTETPFFDDVENTETVYPFLQSCAEWGILETTEGNFEPDKEVTREFAIKTAVISAEVLQPAEGENPFEQCVAYAVDKGIIDSDKQDYLEETITYGEGQEILDWAVMEFQNREFVEYSNVELNEEVIDLTESDMEYSADSGIVTASGTTNELQVGDVFIAPGNEEAPDGIARKVTGISEDAQGRKIIETSEPALEEIYKAMDFAVRAVPTEADVTTYEGVTLVSAQEYDTLLARNKEYNAYAMTWNEDDYNVQQVGKGSNFSFTVNMKNGETPKATAEWESSFASFKKDLMPKEPELEGGDPEAEKWFEKSSTLYEGKADGTRLIEKIDNKFSDGYEITGTLAIKDMYVDVESETKKFLGIPVGVKSFSVKTNYQVESTLKINGSFEEELKLTTFHIQTPVPGLTVKLEVILFVNASGELEVKFVTTNCTTTAYDDGKIKKVDSSKSTAADIAMALEVEVGVSVKAVPSVLGVEIIDVKVKASVKFNFDAAMGATESSKQIKNEIWEIRTWYLTLSGDVTMPIIKLEVGTGNCLLKLNKKWELVGENGLVKVGKRRMFEENLNVGQTLIKRVPIESPTPMPTETPAATPGAAAGNTGGNLEPGKGIGDFNAERLDIDNYMLSVKPGEVATLTVTSIPEGYSQEDIYWECGDTSVATISDGMVTGVGAGTTQVKVYTSDGKYEILCTIIVSDDTKVEFNAL